MGDGSPEDKTRCIMKVSDHDSRWPHHNQCSRKRGYGPGGEYCKIHDPAAVKARNEKRQAKWNAQSKADREKWHAQDLGRMLIRAGFDTEEKVKALIQKQ
jgi:hypothetical protein